MKINTNFVNQFWIASKINNFFQDGEVDPKQSIIKLRELCELLLSHLSTFSDDDEVNEIHHKVKKLESLGLIDHQFVPYFQFWWSAASIANHFQEYPISENEWKTHYNMIEEVAKVCLGWYSKKYPPLELTEEMRSNWLKDVYPIFSIQYEDVVVFNKEKLISILDKNNYLILHGPSWVGKTTIASHLATDYVSQGYIPIFIHENSVLSSELIKIINKEDCFNIKLTNIRINNNSNKIHELITTRLFHGDSFLIYLDDPFGHRQFLQPNPLYYLKLTKWLSLANNPKCFGKLKIIITTPTKFLNEALSVFESDSSKAPDFHNNGSLFKGQNSLEIKIESYSKDQLHRIVVNVARGHDCGWHLDKNFTELLSDVLFEKKHSFDILHVFCRENRISNENSFLASLELIEKSDGTFDEIKKTGDEEKVLLSAAFVSEALIEFCRDYSLKENSISFKDICLASLNIVDDSHFLANSFSSRWLVSDKISTFNLSTLPVFSHPEIRYCVSVLVENQKKDLVRTILINLCGLSDSFDGKVIERWQATHVVCRNAKFFNSNDGKKIASKLFNLSQVKGGDPENVIWAIVGNWNAISGTDLEETALKFINQIPYQRLAAFSRPFIWAVAENWCFINKQIKFALLSLSGKGADLENLKPFFDTHHTLAFLAAGISNLRLIQETAKKGCESSEKYLNFINSFVQLISVDKKHQFIGSIKGDGLFNSPGKLYKSKDVLQKLQDLGKKTYNITVNDSFYNLIKSCMDKCSCS